MTTQTDTPARPSRLLVLVPAQVSLMVGLGLLLTRGSVADLLAPVENRVTRAFAAGRTTVADTLTSGLSMVAGTEAIIAVALLCVAALLLLPSSPRWAEAVFLGASVAVQSAVFLVVTVFVQRARPDVPHLDAAPPTSSFPSGHVGASVALFGGLAVLALRRLRGPWRYLAVTALLLVPPLVGLSRLYRGMHHPTDVLGGLLNGTLTLLVVGSVLLAGRERRPHTADNGNGNHLRPSPAGASGGLATGRVVVVRHPHACDEPLADRVRAVLEAHGYRHQQWTRTTAERPSGDLDEICAAPAPDGTARSRVDLVVSCGGDGTVRACADVVAGTGIALAVVPCGTGNLLARNLGLPLDPATALDEALDGDCFGIDVGRVWGDRLVPARFTVMAGAGFDAAMVRDAPPRLKARLGWAAYLLAGARHLRDPRGRVSVRVDGGPRRRHRARMVVVGNVGTLQGGIELLPGARADSGRLDVVLFDPEGAAGWLTATGHLVSRALRPRSPESRQKTGTPRTGSDPAASGRRSVAGGALTYYSGRRIDIRFAGTQPREIDGDTVVDGRRLVVETEPGALRVRLPRSARSTGLRPEASAPRRSRGAVARAAGAPDRSLPADVLAPLAPRRTQSGS
ncbi:diacylglycerol kinase family enzyme/membrane-associated phospholipid phosphatase [Streptomyces sp. PvR006]|uniref:diacylglycerol kinase family protein n=1 Tax=Streptomyces sp. PvR006 TaxID=2817860 RepID=UPI001AEB44E7|nr:diacylglycerol kinase family protein [Streptomyces sp. PvR006]MBP2579601.1 diacylglycerol kinase family enzyme/membrane-associated phospholipid phosphatase [Streptomyces sp. PvR006]